VELTGTNRITVNEVTTWSANEMGKPGCRSSREKNCPVRTLNQRAVGPASSSATTLLPGQTSPMPVTAATATSVSGRAGRLGPAHASLGGGQGDPRWRGMTNAGSSQTEYNPGFHP